MLLDNKFVVVNRKNVECVIELFLGFGYNRSYDINRTLEENKLFHNCNKFAIFISDIDKDSLVINTYEYFIVMNMYNRKEFNINKLLREYKLKRILKCC